MYLLILVRTVIYYGPRDQEVDASTDVVFKCNATTDPREAVHLAITWKRDGDGIDFANEPRFLHNATDNTLMIIASEVGDSGNYACVADNGVDFDEVTATLTVIDGKVIVNIVAVDGLAGQEVTASTAVVLAYVAIHRQHEWHRVAWSLELNPSNFIESGGFYAHSICYTVIQTGYERIPIITYNMLAT